MPGMPGGPDACRSCQVPNTMSSRREWADAPRRGMERLCCMMQHMDYGPGYKIPQVLIVSPVYIGEDMVHCPYASFGLTAPAKSRSLSPLYEEVAKVQGCMFLDASTVTPRWMHIGGINHPKMIRDRVPGTTAHTAAFPMLLSLL